MEVGFVGIRYYGRRGLMNQWSGRPTKCQPAPVAIYESRFGEGGGATSGTRLALTPSGG